LPAGIGALLACSNWVFADLGRARRGSALFYCAAVNSRTFEEKHNMKNKKILILIACGFLCLGGLAYWLYQPVSGGTHITKSEMMQYEYVASSIRGIYHKPSCRWAQKISASNLIGFKSRDEAEKSGRRPCKVCKP
jgi:hypothetical protein